jgi:hypothetical protein
MAAETGERDIASRVEAPERRHHSRGGGRKDAAVAKTGAAAVQTAEQ